MISQPCLIGPEIRGVRYETRMVPNELIWEWVEVVMYSMTGHGISNKLLPLLPCDFPSFQTFTRWFSHCAINSMLSLEDFQTPKTALRQNSGPAAQSGTVRLATRRLDLLSFFARGVTMKIQRGQIPGVGCCSIGEMADDGSTWQKHLTFTTPRKIGVSQVRMFFLQAPRIENNVVCHRF